MIGDSQVRNVGTIGGNIAHADPASDLPTVLVALDATIHAPARRACARYRVRILPGHDDDIARACRDPDSDRGTVEAGGPGHGIREVRPSRRRDTRSSVSRRSSRSRTARARMRASRSVVCCLLRPLHEVERAIKGSGAPQPTSRASRRRGQGRAERRIWATSMRPPTTEGDGPRVCRARADIRPGSRQRSQTPAMLPASIDDLQALLARQRYVADRSLAVSVYLALRLRRPLFLEGEAGVGKTEIAKALAAALETELIRLQCYEGIDVSSGALRVELPATASRNSSRSRRLMR